MKITVHEQEKRFYLAMNDWSPIVGLGFTIGKHSFCATPYGDEFSCTIIFSEVTSGARVRIVELDFFDLIILDEKSKFIELIKSEAGKIANALKKKPDLDNEILKMEYLAISKLGPKPPTEEVDFEGELNKAAQ